MSNNHQNNGFDTIYQFGKDHGIIQYAVSIYLTNRIKLSQNMVVG